MSRRIDLKVCRSNVRSKALNKESALCLCWFVYDDLLKNLVDPSIMPVAKEWNMIRNLERTIHEQREDLARVVKVCRKVT